MLSDYQRYRVYEFLPGASIWAALIGGVGLAFLAPITMMYVVIVFDVYWVIRVLYFSFYVALSWRRFRRAGKVAWFDKLEREIPNWAEKINVIFLPMYNESAAVVAATLQALARSSYPVRRLYIVISGEARQLEHWQKVQSEISRQFFGVFAD